MTETPQKIDDGGQAFPSPTYAESRHQGMSVRTYAAIHLKVPSSGIDWLDEMIQQANRLELAGMAMQGILACEQAHPNISQTNNEDLAECAVEIADATIKAERKDQSP